MHRNVSGYRLYVDSDFFTKSVASPTVMPYPEYMRLRIELNAKDEIVTVEVNGETTYEKGNSMYDDHEPYPPLDVVAEDDYLEDYPEEFYNSEEPDDEWLVDMGYTPSGDGLPWGGTAYDMAEPPF